MAAAKNAELEEPLRLLAEGEFGFIDGGCGTGGSIEYCEKTFRRGRGIGFDSSAKKIELAQAAGHKAYEANLASLSLPEKCVSFVSFLDVLEHFPDVQTTESVLKNMAMLARDFIFIRHPNFEDIGYLKEHGLKLDWTDWHGHPNPMLLSEFDAMFCSQGWFAPSVFGQKPIHSSAHPSIIPIDAPRDTVGYDLEKHGVKPSLQFDRPIYSQFDIFVCLNSDLSNKEWRNITKSVVKSRNRTRAVAPLGI